VRQQIRLGGRLYPKSYILDVGCKSGSLTIGAPLHIEQYRMFTAVFGVPDNADNKSPLDYAVIVDGVTRASGRVGLGQAKRVTVPLDNAQEILVRSSSSAVLPSESCDASAVQLLFTGDTTSRPIGDALRARPASAPLAAPRPHVSRTAGFAPGRPRRMLRARPLRRGILIWLSSARRRQHGFSSAAVTKIDQSRRYTPDVRRCLFG
jgi:hypothetical protein